MRVAENLHLLYQMTRCSFLEHEKNSALGMVWHLVNPLAMSLVVYVVFSNVGLFSDIPNYPLFILVGVINFNFFTQSPGRAASGMIYSRTIVLNTTIPREILVLRSVCLDGVTYLIESLLVLALVAVMGPGLGWSAFGYVFIAIGMWMLTLGVSFLLAGSIVYLTDLLYIWGVLSRMLFFLTPIFYYTRMIESELVMRFIELNPLGAMISLGRKCVLEGTALGAGDAAFALIGPGAVLALGWFAFQRLKVAIPEVI